MNVVTLSAAEEIQVELSSAQVALLAEQATGFLANDWRRKA